MISACPDLRLSRHIILNSQPGRASGRPSVVFAHAAIEHALVAPQTSFRTLHLFLKTSFCRRVMLRLCARLAFFHADFGEEFPSRTLRRPLRRGPLEKRGKRGGQQKGQKGKRTRENKSLDPRFTATGHSISRTTPSSQSRDMDRAPFIADSVFF